MSPGLSPRYDLEDEAPLASEDACVSQTIVGACAKRDPTGKGPAPCYVKTMRITADAYDRPIKGEYTTSSSIIGGFPRQMRYTTGLFSRNWLPPVSPIGNTVHLDHLVAAQNSMRLRPFTARDYVSVDPPMTERVVTAPEMTSCQDKIRRTVRPQSAKPLSTIKRSSALGNDLQTSEQSLTVNKATPIPNQKPRPATASVKVRQKICSSEESNQNSVETRKKNSSRTVSSQTESMRRPQSALPTYRTSSYVGGPYGTINPRTFVTSPHGTRTIVARYVTPADIREIRQSCPTLRQDRLMTTKMRDFDFAPHIMMQQKKLETMRLSQTMPPRCSTSYGRERLSRATRAGY